MVAELLTQTNEGAGVVAVVGHFRSCSRIRKARGKNTGRQLRSLQPVLNAVTRALPVSNATEVILDHY
jgi:hypothetical protein